MSAPLSVPWLGRLIAVLSSHYPGFDSRSVRVRFMVGKLTLVQDFLRLLQFSFVFITTPMFSINLHLHSYNKIQQDALLLKFILVKNCTCLGLIYCSSSGILILDSQQLVFVILVMLLSAKSAKSVRNM